MLMICSAQCGSSVQGYRLWQPRLLQEHTLTQLLEIPKRAMLTSSQDRAQSLSQLVSFLLIHTHRFVCVCHMKNIAV